MTRRIPVDASPRDLKGPSQDDAGGDSLVGESGRTYKILSEFSCYLSELYSVKACD